MKYIFTFLLLFIILIPNTGKSQTQYIPIDPATNKTTYSEIVEVANKKDALYKNAQTWITKSFGDYKSVIQFEDKSEGKLIIKAFSKLEAFLSDRLNYTITIDCKDNKYRCVISDIYQSPSQFPTDRFPIERLNEMIDKEVNDLLKIEKELSEVKKKSQIKELTENKDQANRFLADYKNQADFTDKTMKGFLSSLKQAMSVKDDF